MEDLPSWSQVSRRRTVPDLLARSSSGGIMPFKSRAQRRKFAELLVKGKITPEAYERWNRETGGAELPDHVKPKTRRRTSRKSKAGRGRKRAGGDKSRCGRDERGRRAVSQGARSWRRVDYGMNPPSADLPIAC